MGVLISLSITMIFSFGNDRVWKYTFPLGQLIIWTVYASYKGIIVWI
ncbi:MAG: hypothetical protein ACXW2E_01275 [Nitrososphaeraceae archaeon]